MGKEVGSLSGEPCSRGCSRHSSTPLSFSYAAVSPEMGPSDQAELSLVLDSGDGKKHVKWD